MFSKEIFKQKNVHCLKDARYNCLPLEYLLANIYSLLFSNKWFTFNIGTHKSSYIVYYIMGLGQKPPEQKPHGHKPPDKSPLGQKAPQ